MTERIYHTPGSDARVRRAVEAVEQNILDQPRYVVSPPPFTMLLGKPTSNIAQGASGTFAIYSGTTKGSETATTATIENVYCRAAAIASTQMAYLQPVDSGWEAVPAECP